MEAKEVVFSAVENLSHPMLLVQKSGEEFEGVYANIAMRKLLPDSVSAEKFALDENLLPILQEYESQENKNSYSVYDVVIYGGTFTLHCTQSSMGVGILFMQTQLDSILNSLSFQELSKSCGALSVVLNVNGEILDTNSCFLDLVNFQKEEVVEKNFFEMFIPGDSEQLGEYFKNILSEKSYHKHFMTPLKTKDDKLYKINWQVSKIKKQSQTYIIAIGSDVSKLFKENSRLKKQLTSIQVGFEYFPFSVGYMDAEGIFTKMNVRFMKMFGISELKQNIFFDTIPLLKKNIGFASLQENIKFVKEMKYRIDYEHQGKHAKLRVNIRMIKGKKNSDKLYIVVVQQEH